jgi:hypothetical protein
MLMKKISTLLLILSVLFIVSLSAMADDTTEYYIQAKHSGKILDVKDNSQNNGAQIIQYQNNGTNNQKFKFIPCPNDSGYYFIQAKHSGKILDVKDNSQNDLANIIQYQNNGTDNQKFKFIPCPNDSGYYFIQAKHSGRILDVKDYSQNNGANIIQYQNNGTDNQKFKFIKINLGLDKEGLLKQYAPKVWLNSNEKFMPSSVEWAFPYLTRYKNSDGKYWIKTKKSLTSPSDWSLDVFKGNLQTAPVYSFWQDKGTDVNLVYFFYYPYNRGKEVLGTIFGNHVGDWESIVIKTRKTDNTLLPYSISLAYHSWYSDYNWNDISKEDTHPIIYSANGSHGSWKDPGKHVYQKIKGIYPLEDNCGAGIAWNTWNNVKCFDYENKQGINTSWPAWLNTDYSNPGTGDSSIPGNGPIYRWGNEKMGVSYFGYYRLEDGPTGPMDKDIWAK